MSMLAELVELVIGVDTHADTHTAAVVSTINGAVLATVTVVADADGYTQLLTWAEQHGGLRAWAIEGAGGYGAGLARHLAEAEETVLELDRPARPARRGGRKSDVIDAERAARDALARTRLAEPKTGPERAALQALLTARRSAVDAVTAAQRQLRALVITAPESVRARFRGHTTSAMIELAARVRPGTAATDIEVFTVLSTLRAPARRIRTLHTEAADHERALRAIVRAWRPDLLDLRGVGPIVAAVVLTAWSHQDAAAPTPRSPCSPAPPPSPPRRARPCATDSTGLATANSTGRCTPSPCPGCSTTPTPAPTPNDAAAKARPIGRSNAASSATSPASSTASSKTHHDQSSQPSLRLDTP